MAKVKKSKKAKKTKKTNPPVKRALGGRAVKANRSNLSNKANKLPISPLGDRVLIKELGDEEMTKTTAAGIIIPDSADKDSGGKRGKVVAVGSGKTEDGKTIPVRLSVGQTVLYQWGDKIKVKGEEYVIVRESEIIAILNN